MSSKKKTSAKTKFATERRLQLCRDESRLRPQSSGVRSRRAKARLSGEIHRRRAGVAKSYLKRRRTELTNGSESRLLVNPLLAADMDFRNNHDAPADRTTQSVTCLICSTVPLPALGGRESNRPAASSCTCFFVTTKDIAASMLAAEYKIQSVSRSSSRLF